MEQPAINPEKYAEKYAADAEYVRQMLRRMEAETAKFLSESGKFDIERGRLEAEKNKLDAEKHKFESEKKKLEAERLKLARELHWYDRAQFFTFTTVLAGVMSAVATVVWKFLTLP